MRGNDLVMRAPHLAVVMAVAFPAIVRSFDPKYAARAINPYSKIVLVMIAAVPREIGQIILSGSTRGT